MVIGFWFLVSGKYGIGGGLSDEERCFLKRRVDTGFMLVSTGSVVD